MRLGSSVLLTLACVGCAARPARSTAPVVDVAAHVATTAANPTETGETSTPDEAERALPERPRQRQDDRDGS